MRAARPRAAADCRSNVNPSAHGACVASAACPYDFSPVPQQHLTQVECRSLHRPVSRHSTGFAGYLGTGSRDAGSCGLTREEKLRDRPGWRCPYLPWTASRGTQDKPGHIPAVVGASSNEPHSSHCTNGCSAGETQAHSTKGARGQRFVKPSRLGAPGLACRPRGSRPIPSQTKAISPGAVGGKQARG